MFGKNEIVGRKYFEGAGDKLLVTSMFLTLQGEGPYQGRPALFVRLAKCNLACSFCDTFFDKGDWFDLETLAAAVYNKARIKYDNVTSRARVGVVITGGEPSLQRALVPFLRGLVTVPFAFVQVETNGILPFEDLPDDVTVVMSPKCMEEGDKPIRYMNPSPVALERADCLKFVMSADPYSPYRTIPQWALAWTKETGRPVYVSPMNVYNRLPERAQRLRQGSMFPESDLEVRSRDDEVVSAWEPGLLDQEKNRANHELAARYALDHGLNLTLQMHLYASIA
jgi:7-carboxy-7-deazaguanine synthase